MITAIDTNVLLDILGPDQELYPLSARALQNASDSGSLVICDIVYAELSVYFDQQRECDAFLDSLQVRVEPLRREAQFLASRAWRAYRKQGGQRTRILPDFLIASHAQTQANLLLTRDRDFYRKLFPALALIDPSRSN